MQKGAPENSIRQTGSQRRFRIYMWRLEKRGPCMAGGSVTCFVRAFHYSNHTPLTLRNRGERSAACCTV